jgi:hypothetical protein
VLPGQAVIINNGTIGASVISYATSHVTFQSPTVVPSGVVLTFGGVIAGLGVLSIMKEREEERGASERVSE